MPKQNATQQGSKTNFSNVNQEGGQKQSPFQSYNPIKNLFQSKVTDPSTTRDEHYSSEMSGGKGQYDPSQDPENPYRYNPKLAPLYDKWKNAGKRSQPDYSQPEEKEYSKMGGMLRMSPHLIPNPMMSGMWNFGINAYDYSQDNISGGEFAGNTARGFMPFKGLPKMANFSYDASQNMPPPKKQEAPIEDPIHRLGEFPRKGGS